MSSEQSSLWFEALLGVKLPAEGERFSCNSREFVMVGGIPRAIELVSAAQAQTQQTFGYKWSKRDTFEGEIANYMRQWLIEKYGDVSQAPWLFEAGPNPVLLDVGCGASVSGLGLFSPVLDRVRYLGCDVSTAVEVAKVRFAERGLPGAFIQSDLNQLPLPDESVDMFFSEGVLHHTDDTRAALGSVVRCLKKGGRAMFYVYRKKGPVREFTDDYIRNQLQSMTAQQGWDAMKPLSKLGEALGKLNVTIDVPERVDLLDIPAGKIDIQRLFYWHVFKAFYRPEMNLDEMNHINFDWYAPKNAHRHTIEEVRGWCTELGLAIEREKVEDAGITIIARRT